MVAEWPQLVLGVYLSVLGLLCFNGLHRLWQLAVWLRAVPSRRPSFPIDPPAGDDRSSRSSTSGTSPSG